MSADRIESLSGGSRSLDKEYSYVKFPRRDLHHEYSYPRLIEMTTTTTATATSTSTSTSDDLRAASTKSSFKRQHIPVEKTNSAGSEPGKVSLVLIGSGSSLGSSNCDSSNSGSGEALYQV